MMNFYCTIKFEELSLPTFFQGKKKRFETILWCVKLKQKWKTLSLSRAPSHHDCSIYAKFGVDHSFT